MYKILRAAFAVAAAVLISLCVFAGILWDMIAVWACLGGALLFFALSMLFKFLQEEKERKQAPNSPEEDTLPENAEANGKEQPENPEKNDGGK